MAAKRQRFLRQRFPGYNLANRARVGIRTYFVRPFVATLNFVRRFWRRYSFSLSIIATFSALFALASVAVPKTVFTWNYWLGEPEDVRTLLLVFASIGGSMIAVVGIRLSHLRSKAATKQSETSENIYLTDLMVKAAGQLSDKSAFVRLVGINALQRISVQSEPDTIAAANVLAQFFQDILPEYTGSSIPADQHLSTNKLYARRGDASDAARVLSYISTLLADIDHSIYLNRCYFPPSLIFWYGLTKFDFTDCFFKGHDFSSNQISNCVFKKTILEDCDFNIAWLEKSEFNDLSLSGVRFPSTAFIDCVWRNVYGYGTYFGRSTVANGMFF